MSPPGGWGELLPNDLLAVECHEHDSQSEDAHGGGGCTAGGSSVVGHGRSSDSRDCWNSDAGEGGHGALNSCQRCREGGSGDRVCGGGCARGLGCANACSVGDCERVGATSCCCA